MNLAHNGFLTIAGAVLFAKDAYYRLPSFTVKAVVFPGIRVEDTSYIDKQEIKGKLADIFQQTVSFILRNIPHIQNNQNFNSNGESIIPRPAVEELVANALVRRALSLYPASAYSAIMAPAISFTQSSACGNSPVCSKKACPIP
jgi:ATP-dependent DNA helicase RecG